MKSILLNLICLCAFTLAGCATGTVEVPGICSSQEIGTVPASPVGTQFEPITYSTNFDLSDAVNKTKDVADSTSVTITQLILSGTTTLRWVNHVTVTIRAKDVNGPDKVFASYQNDGTGDDYALNMNVLMSSDEIATYLKSPIILTFQIYAPTGPTSFNQLSANICADVTATVSKGL